MTGPTDELDGEISEKDRWTGREMNRMDGRRTHTDEWIGK